MPLTNRVIKTVLLTKNAHFSKADYFASVTKDLFGERRVAGDRLLNRAD